MTNGITRIAVFGVGNVGAPVLDAILAHPGLAKPVILTRNPETNQTVQAYASRATVVKIPSYDDQAAVTKALTEHQIEAAISTSGGANGPTQLPLATAAKEANVKVFVSSEFGIDFRHLPLDKLHPALAARKQFHEKLNELQVPWIGIANGSFAEWVPTAFLGVDLKAHTAAVYGDGKQPFTATSLKDIGRATVLAVLAPLPAPGHGRLYGIVGFEASWNDWLAAAERLTGHKFDVKYLPVSELESLQYQPDLAGIAAFVKAGSADGRFITPPDQVDNKVLGFTPQVGLDDVLKAHLQ